MESRCSELVDEHDAAAQKIQESQETEIAHLLKSHAAEIDKLNDTHRGQLQKLQMDTK